MLTHSSISLIDNWFEGLNQADPASLLPLFQPQGCRIRNAANPVTEGPEAAARLLDDFFDRTLERHFVVVDAAEDTQGNVFACWEGRLVFRPGIQIAGMTVPDPLAVRLRGAERFTVGENGRIAALDIVHETTTLPRRLRLLLDGASQPELPELPQSSKDWKTVGPAPRGDTDDLVHAYFAAEEQGDVEAVVALCHPDVVIRNAANPPEQGLEGAKNFVTNFRNRTERRDFAILNVAAHGNTVFASWAGDIRFRQGTSFGPVIARQAFDIRLEGICRFKLDPNGSILELDVFHETTTAVLLAAGAAQS